ncbi:MAG TPA: VWA domain-containing protein [Microthrixaceae bacterium]|nr:VWA domain-containing protein [Microthrixaceae bacterium]
MSTRHDAVAFVAELRGDGLEVSVAATLDFVAALGSLGVERPLDVYWAGRATLVRRREDADVYDRAFRRHFLGVDDQSPDDRTGGPVLEVVSAVGIDEEPAAPADAAEGEAENDGVSVRYSAVEVLRDRDFARCSPEELDALWRAVDQLRTVLPLRRSARTHPTSGRRGPIDLRRTVAAALRVDGEVIAHRHRRRGTRPRRLLVLVDVSGSMEPYARALVRFAHAAVTSRRGTEVIALGTRMTRLTPALDVRDPDLAMSRAAAEVRDWAGGTRLGEGIRTFLDEWGQRGMARGAVVLMMSDGWDRGALGELEEQMARLARFAHRLIWVNPLKASPGYEPLARGMAAALPYCDDFVEGHSLRSLEDLAALVSGALDPARAGSTIAAGARR